jgi:tRNA threonylcarbamoyladenosine biosynthesis protein TsaB
VAGAGGGGADLAAGGFDGVAVSAGPGSFTGLRVGYGVAKGLCFGTAVRFVAVPTAEAVAAACVRTRNPGPGAVIVSAAAAGRGEVYVAAFRTAETGLAEVFPPRVVREADLVSIVLPAGRVYVAGAGPEAAACANALGGEAVRLPDAAPAECTALIGAALLESGAEMDPASAEPNYFHDPAAAPGT